MVTLTVILVAIGFYFFYQTSERAYPSRTLRVERWMYMKQQPAKSLGAICLITAIFPAIAHWGAVAGVLFFLVTLMTVGSLIVLLTPLRIIGYRSLAVVALVSLLIEITF
ncbi:MULTISPECIES: hypothetical protein [Reichenbachiella]|uniref:Uncharacterized protein n=1 Tax=Reichenbachiella agariperforans TaxID=156994 RepID=A0A1M6JMU3_REIAG|nr:MULTISPECIES: hypothetical protein [Reichenbachiella]MBU2913260.1 hypothetical protein [Reichenbachiella agariperforans]RJE74750.1 hypothetical protein BGP76_16590 [Reichenbachiella sp. MSK19-1]SHJ48039.1 hypothetical protein SAMN04488028_101252 [Reichenbachiella agariperforans]